MEPKITKNQIDKVDLVEVLDVALYSKIFYWACYVAKSQIYIADC